MARRPRKRRPLRTRSRVRKLPSIRAPKKRPFPHPKISRAPRIPKWRIYDARLKRALTPLEQARQLNYARESLKFLRQFFTGFDQKDGYDLRHPERLTTAQFNRLRKLAPFFNEIAGQPYKIFRPRSDLARRVVQRRTGQNYKNQKAFPIPTDSPDKVRFRVTRSGKFEILRRVRGATVVKREYLFPRKPKSFDHLIKMTQAMLPRMPKGYYVALTETHGLTGAPAPKHLLIKQLQGWEVQYEVVRDNLEHDNPQGFAEAIMGFQLTAVQSGTALREWRERITTRQMYRRELEKLRARQRAKRYRLSKRAKVTGRL